MKYTVVVLVVIFIGAGATFACQFDTDCRAGSKCYKPGNSLYGWCVGGMFPGNQNDRKPARDMMDMTRKKGNTCSYDLQCGVNGKCLKQKGALYGTCF